MGHRPLRGGVFLILRNPVAEDFVISHGIAVLSDRITGVAFNRVNSAVFHFLNNSCMVGLSVLSGFVVPIEEDDHTRRRLGAVTVLKAAITSYSPKLSNVSKWMILCSR